MTNATKPAWTAPVLETLDVDLEAITARNRSGNDSPGMPSTKS